MYKSNIMHEVSNFRKLAEFAIKMPWPMKNRSIYAGVSALPVIGKNAIIINMQTPKSDIWLKDLKIEKIKKTEEI